MILLIGATSYIGRTFARALRRRKDPFIPLSRTAFEYTEFEFLFDYVRKIRPDLIINAEEVNDAPSTGSGEQDPQALDGERMEMLQANTLLPQTISRVCSLTNTPWAHVSSGSIYSGAKIIKNGQLRAETDPEEASTRTLFDTNPESILGYTEVDEPNCSFKCPPSSFYCGTKALAEEAIRRDSETYIWRLQLPFGERDEPGNFLSQLRDCRVLRETVTSLSHAEECVGACLELWERRAPFGTYNVVNPGAITVRELVDMVQRIRKTTRDFRLLVFENGSESISTQQAVPTSDCILDSSKLMRTGVTLRHSREALEHALANWEPRRAPRLKRFA